MRIFRYVFFNYKLWKGDKTITPATLLEGLLKSQYDRSEIDKTQNKGLMRLFSSIKSSTFYNKKRFSSISYNNFKKSYDVPILQKKRYTKIW